MGEKTPPFKKMVGWRMGVRPNLEVGFPQGLTLILYSCGIFLVHCGLGRKIFTSTVLVTLASTMFDITTKIGRDRGSCLVAIGLQWSASMI